MCPERLSSLPVLLGLEKEIHLRFINQLDAHTKRLEYYQANCSRICGIYWALTALLLLEPQMDPQSAKFATLAPLSREAIIDFVVACQRPSGGFSANLEHDAHLTFTTSALQILTMLDALDDPRIDHERAVSWIAARQQSDGSFSGDEHGEIDTRFSYCAVSALSLLKRLDAIDVDGASSFVQACRNADGAYGAMPGGESHAGQVFCCVGTLLLLGRPIMDVDRLSEWLAWRQLPSGGLNGRPQKLEDVCYSWWVLSSLAMLDRLDWIDRSALCSFILACQDPVSGGFSDRPGNVADIFHTLFGIAGLSLLNYQGLAPVDPRFCMPIAHLQKQGLAQRMDNSLLNKN